MYVVHTYTYVYMYVNCILLSFQETFIVFSVNLCYQKVKLTNSISVVNNLTLYFVKKEKFVTNLLFWNLDFNVGVPLRFTLSGNSFSIQCDVKSVRNLILFYGAKFVTVYSFQLVKV